MTTKTVAVQLVAMTSQYQKAMGSATASTAKLQATSATAGKSIGSVMGPQIALAGAVAGAAAIKMALDFDDAFTRIAAVTDTSQAQVAQWRDEVLTLAGSTARAPQELAEALYFLASAGLDADQVMPTLEASAKAAAVGLGETADIARLTANAINAYSSSGLTATQVTDTLVAAVREGTAEPEEFADAMGRILPVASKAGISFDQVAASLAGLSNIGLDVNEGVTAMRGLLMALEAPGSQAADALDSIGLSADDVRRSLSEDGLIATLRLLETQTGGNIDTLRKIVPNVRALTGVFGLTGQEAAKVNEIFHDVQASTGSLDEAFKKTEQSAGHKLRKAFAELQAAAVRLGSVMLPIITDAIDKLESLGSAAAAAADRLAFLRDPIEKAAEGQTLFDNALTRVIPGMQIFNAALDAIPDASNRVTMSQEEMAAAFDKGKVAGSSLLHQLFGLGDGALASAAKLGGVAGAAGDTKGPLDDVGNAAGDAGGEFERAGKLADGFTLALKTLAGIALDAEEAAISWAQAVIDLREELRSGTKTLHGSSQAALDNRTAFLDAANAAIDHGAAIAAKTGSIQLGVKATREHIAQLRQEAIAAGFTKAEIDAYIRTLNLTPKQISTLIQAKTETAKAAVRGFIGDLDRIPNIKEVLIRVRSTGLGTGQQIGHSGGVVGNLPRYHGGGDVKSDEQLVLARKGETIRTVAQERALMSSRGAGSSGTTNVVVINRITPKLDRRRYGEELEQDTTYDGRWAS